MAKDNFRIDMENVWKHIEMLCNFPDRIAGTENIEKASRYILDYLKRINGLEVWIERFHFLTSFPIESYFEIIEPEFRSINCFPNLFSENTSDEGITGEIIYLGGGGEEEYSGKDCVDKFVLVELSYSPPRTEKARIASNNKAKALIIMNWGHSENRIVGRGAIKSVWGIPTTKDLEKIPKIVSINISKFDGEYIKNILSRNSKVKGKIKVKVRNEWVNADQPMCRIESLKPEFKEEFIIVGGHLEAWGKTATDNSAGNAIMLEMIRILSEKRDKLLRSILFGFWDGHEIGEAAGSAYFVDYYWSDLNSGGVAYVNIDGCGLAGASRFVSYSSPETWKFLEEVEKEVIGKPSEKKLPLKFGDNSFQGIGIPYIFTFTTYKEDELEKLGGAIFGWWYHSEEDTLDKIDKELLEIQARLYMEYVLRLLCTPLLPFDFIKFIEVIEMEIAKIKEAFPEYLLTSHIYKLEKEVNELKKQLIEIYKLSEEYKDQYNLSFIKSFNQLLLKLCRILIPVFRSTVEKYSHDVYGCLYLSKPLPRIYKILDNMVKISRDDWKNHALKIELTRQYNVLHDSLIDAISLCRNFLNKH
ncbi:MAG: M28 family metallopeptidase [Nitrososphaerota archaeon]